MTPRTPISLVAVADNSFIHVFAQDDFAITETPLPLCQAPLDGPLARGQVVRRPPCVRCIAVQHEMTRQLLGPEAELVIAAGGFDRLVELEGVRLAAEMHHDPPGGHRVRYYWTLEQDDPFVTSIIGDVRMWAKAAVCDCGERWITPE